MAKFLRDEFLKNITITEKDLGLINDFLSEKETANNRNPDLPADDEKVLLLNYVIRFDGRGYNLNDFSEVMKYYSEAADIERVVFVLDSNLSVKTNNVRGERFAIHLDPKNPNNSFINVSSDDRSVIDPVFHGLMEIISKCQNINGLVRNTWSQLLIQILGVAAGFVISLIVGMEISPYVNIENAFVISFLFAFLIFSNLWGFINQQILKFIDYSFPNIKFSRKGKLSFHWLAQTLVGGLILIFTVFLLSHAYDWVVEILGQYVSK